MGTATLRKVETSPTPPPNGKPRRLISKDGIKAARPASHEDVPCDEWEEGTAFRVGPMDYDTHEMWEIAIIGLKEDISGETLKGLRLKIVGRSMIDDRGDRVFKTDDEILTALGPRDWRPIERGVDAVLRISKNLDEQVEDAVKNSDSSRSDEPSTE